MSATPKQPTSTDDRGAHSLHRRVRRWRRHVPDRDGWWMWREDYDRDLTERLLIVCGSEHSEVSGDDDLGIALGRGPYRDRKDNYWEGTDTKTMGGYWMQEPNAAGERPR